MSLLINVLTLRPVNWQVIWIIIIIELCLNKNFVVSIKTCRNKVDEMYIVQDKDTSVEVSFCFTDFQTNNTEVSVKHNKAEFRAPDDKVTFNWTTENNVTYNLQIYIYNITVSDLTEWTLLLNNKQNKMIYYETSFTLNADSSDQFYKIDNKYLNELQVELVCTSSNFPKKLQIIDRCEGIQLEKNFSTKNYKRTLELKYDRNSVKTFPKILAAYECKIIDFQNRIKSIFLDLDTENEPALICLSKDKVTKANVFDTVYIRFKVLAYPNITSVVVTRFASVNIEDTQWKLEIRNVSRVLWSVELSKDNIQEQDLGNYTVSVTSNVNLPVNTTFILCLKDIPRVTETSWGIFSNESLIVLYKLVKSGLPLTKPTNISNSYTIHIDSNKMANEYMVKVFLHNYEQFIWRKQDFTLMAGSKENVFFSFNISEKYNTLVTCASSIPETIISTRIGESVTFTMCIMSNSLIRKEDVGFNRITVKNCSLFKWSVEIHNEANKYNIKWTLKNVTRHDIKFYTFRVRDILRRTAIYILNLKLEEGAPYKCDDIKPQVKPDSIKKTLDMRYCVRSYPVLSRDIFVNDILYRINKTTYGVIVDSSVDEETFSNYLTLKIPVTDYVQTVNITVKSVLNMTFSFTVNTSEYEEMRTTLTTLRSSTATETIITTSEHEDPWKTTAADSDPVNTSHTNIIISSVLAVVITVLLTVVLVYFVYFRRKLAKRTKSLTPRLKYLHQTHYNNMEELKSFKVDKDQNLSNYETRYANIVKECNVDQGMQKHRNSLSTELAPGRHRNEEGLIYITIDHSDLQSRSSKSNISKSSQSGAESNYVTIDPFKTKHFK